MEPNNFTRNILLITFLFLSINLLKSQTIFEDAVALNFKNSGTYNAACFNQDGTLIVAKVVRGGGGTYLEIGKFDENGSYTKTTHIGIKNKFTEVEVKFNSNGDKVAFCASNSEDRFFEVANVATGNSINDFEPEAAVSNFTFVPDGNYIAYTAGNNSYLYDYMEDVIVQPYKDNILIGMSKDGNLLYCKTKNDVINYISTKSGIINRSFVLKNYKSIDFDARGELIACSYPPYVKFFKLTQNGLVEVKDFENASNSPTFSSTFNYCVVDDNSSGKRNVYSLTENLIYQSKIESYQTPGKFIFSQDDKRMVLLTDKELYCYDFEMIKYFSRMAKRFADLYQTNDQFQTDKDLLNRADRIKSRKKDLLSVFTDELKVSEASIKNKQHFALGVFETKITGLGVYDPNTEMYEVTMAVPVNYTQSKDITAKVKIPKSQAEIFNNYYKNFKVTGIRLLNDNLNGVYAFNIQIINDVNNVVYRCIIHRTLPLTQMSYEEKYDMAQKNYDSRNWFEAVLYLSDFPDDFLKNSVIDMMIQNSLNYYFDEKWTYVYSLGLNTDPGLLLTYLADFPKTYKTADISDMRKRVVDNVLDGRLQRVKDMIKDKTYSEALEYLDKSIPAVYKEVFSSEDCPYSNYNETKPIRNTLYFEIGKRSIDGGNYQRAVEMLSQVTQDSPNYSDAQKLLNEAKTQIK